VDPFLLTHQVNDFLLDIGCRLSPVSIRDQMMRGYLAATRALNENKIGPDKPLLVVGAGAAGATAAIVAADNDVNTVLIDMAPAAFNKQLYCHTRFVCPTTYDWPAEHWHEGRFPWLDEQALPLPYNAGEAARIAALWDAALKVAEEERRPLLKLRFNTEMSEPSRFSKVTAADLEASGGLVDVIFKSTVAGVPPIPSQKFALIISCIGQGRDRRSVGRYSGYSFWEDDPFSQEGWGLIGGTEPKIYISGGGDGALQDFLRILTNVDSISALFLRLPEPLRLDAAASIRSTEDHSQRAYIWSTPALDCAVFAPLHKLYVKTVDDLLTKYPDAIECFMRETLRAPLGKIKITLACSCTHFGSCYPLNRFLVLLYARYIERHYEKIGRDEKVIRYGVRTVKIEAKEHDECGPLPKNCHDKLHEIYFIDADCETSVEHENDEGLQRQMKEGPYNIVIIRHGIEWPPPLFVERPSSNARHLLPYYLNW
jgi:hypothetical protein